MTQIYIGIEAGYIDRTHGLAWIKEVKELGRMLGALIKHWKSK